MREDFRNFRLDRVSDVATGSRFRDEPGKRLEDFLRSVKAQI
jgi:predicted DNA-binding transcriptional regulator YafY